jgi:hypothetical protein
MTRLKREKFFLSFFPSPSSYPNPDPDPDPDPVPWNPCCNVAALNKTPTSAGGREREAASPSGELGTTLPSLVSERKRKKQ